MTKTALRVGIVGCGAVVREYYAVVLPSLAQVVVSAVCDRDEKAAEAVAGILHSRAMPLEELFASVDWVIIATPPASHFQIARRAIEAGLNVLVEKPFVPSPAEAESLIELADKARKRLVVGQFRRYFPPTVLAREMLSTGWFGQIEQIEIYEGGKFSWSTMSGYVSRDVYGGVLFDTGSHAIDQALHVAGLEEELLTLQVVHVQRQGEEPSHEIEAQLQMRTKGRELAVHVFLSRYRALSNVIKVFTDRACIEFDLGYEGAVRVAGRFDAGVTRQLGDAVEAFQAELRDAFWGCPPRIAARSVLNQIRVVNAINTYKA